MTRPAGRAAIEIIGDATKFGPKLQLDVDKALRALRLNLKPVSDQIADGLKDGIDKGKRAFDSIDESAKRSFREVVRDADRILGEVAHAGDVGGAAIGRAFQRGGERAEAAFREMGRVAGREFAAIALKAEVASKSMESSFSQGGKKIRAALSDAARTVLKAASILASVGSLAAPATTAFLATGKAIAAVGRGLAALGTVSVAFLPSLLGSIALVIKTLKLAGPGLSTAFEPIKHQFVDLEGNATAITKTIQQLVSQGVEPLARSFVKVNLPTIIAAMDQIAIATNGMVVAIGRWVNTAEGQKLVGTIAGATADAFFKLAPQISNAAIALGQLAGRAGDKAIVGLGNLLGKLLDKFTAWADSTTMDDINAGLDKIKGGWEKARVAFDHVKAVVDWVVANQDTIKTFSTALGVFSLIGAAITGNPFAVIIAGIGLLLSNWNEVTKAFSDSPLAAALPAIKDAMASIVSSIQSLLPVILQVIVQVLLIAAAFAPLVAVAVKLAATVLPLLVPALQLVNAVIAPLVPAVTALAAVLAGALGAAVTALIGPLTAFAGFLASNPELVWVLVAAIVAWQVASAIQAGTLGVLTIAIELVRIGVLAWEAAQWLLNIALDANPVGVVVIAIAALVAIVILAWKHSDKFREIIIGLWHGIEAAGKAIAGGFLAAVHAVADFFVSIGSTLASLPAKIGGALAALPGLIGRALAAIPGLLVDALGLMFTLGFRAVGIGIGLILAAIIGLAKLIVFAFTDLPGIVAGFFADMWDQAVKLTIAGAVALVTGVRDFGVNFLHAMLELGPLVGNFFADLWRNAVELTLRGVAAIVQFAVALPGQIGAAIAALPTIIGNAFVVALAFARNTVVSGFNSIVEFARSVPGRLAALGPAMLSAGASLIHGFLSGLKNVGGFFGDVGGAILSGLKSGLNAVIRAINSGIADIDNLLPFSLPRIPQLATGGLTTGEGLANLHPKELVLPLEDKRAVDLLSKALAEADAGLRATGVIGPDASTTPAEMHFDVRVFIGDRELTDIVDVQISESNRGLRRRVQAGGR